MMSNAEGAITRAASQLPQEEGGGDEQRKRGNDSFALTSWVPQQTPALDEDTVVWSVWRSPHPKYLCKAVRRWRAPVRV